MLKIGTMELVLILAVVLLIFGPSRLPALGKMIGGAFGKLRNRANTEWEDEEEEEEEESEAAEAAEETEAADDDTTNEAV